MIKTIIFDFDGVIADSFSYHFKKMINIAKNDFGVKERETKIIDEIRSKSYFELMKTFKISWTRIPTILKIINQSREEIFKNIDKIKIFPGIMTLLKSLKKRNFQLMILSSNLEKNILKFDRINKIEFFDEIYCEVNILGKAFAIRKVLKENHLDKESVIYIGDEIRDVEAARKAGIKVIGVSWGFQKPEILKKYSVDFIAKKPMDILKIINKN